MRQHSFTRESNAFSLDSTVDHKMQFIAVAEWCASALATCRRHVFRENKTCLYLQVLDSSSTKHKQLRTPSALGSIQGQVLARGRNALEQCKRRARDMNQRLKVEKIGIAGAGAEPHIQRDASDRNADRENNGGHRERANAKMRGKQRRRACDERCCKYQVVLRRVWTQQCRDGECGGHEKYRRTAKGKAERCDKGKSVGEKDEAEKVAKAVEYLPNEEKRDETAE